MSKGSRPDTVNAALRDAGFVCIPNLWVRPHDMPKIHDIAHQYSGEVNAIRGKIRAAREQKEASAEDPRLSKESAWDAFERHRGHG